MNPCHSSNGRSEKFTDAMPQVMPALVNSVISCGRRTPSGFALRSYQPQPAKSPVPLAKPAMLVDSAKSADMTRNSGRPYFVFDQVLTHAPHLESAARFGSLAPGAAYRSAG